MIWMFTLLAPALAVEGSFDSVVLGEDHGCAVTDDRRVACWDRTAPAADPTRAATIVDGLAGVSSLAAGDHHTCAITVDGKVHCWGDNGAGQLGAGHTRPVEGVIELTGLPPALEVAAGTSHTCALSREGAISCWGNNLYGQLGTTDLRFGPFPIPVPDLPRATGVAAGYGHTCAQLGDGTVSCWGDDAHGQLGSDQGEDSLRPPTPIEGLPGTVRDVVARGHLTCTLHDDGVTCWGATGRDAPPWEQPRPAVTHAGIIQVSPAGPVGCGLGADHRVTCWGTAPLGLLGARAGSRPIVGAFGLLDATSIAAVEGYACATRAAGSVECWGRWTDEERESAAQEAGIRPEGQLKAQERETPTGVRYKLSVDELLAPGGSRVRLLVTSVDNHPCANARIGLETTTKRRKTILTLGEPELPDDVCVPAPGPATVTLELPLDASGRHDIILRRERKEDFYQVVVTPSKIEVVPLQSHYTMFSGAPVAWRVPPGSLAISCKDHRDAPVCDRRVRAGLGTCSAVLDDPDLLSMPALKSHSFANQWFAADDQALLVSPDDGHGAIRGLVEEVWYDGSRCTEVRVRTWEGETWSNSP